MATVDTRVLNALLTQVASAAQAAADAAKAAGEPKRDAGPDWSKLLTKPSEVQAPKILEVDDNTPLEAMMNPGDVQIRFRSGASASGSNEGVSSISRATSTPTRTVDDQGDGHVDKRMKADANKKQKISRLAADYEGKIRTIQIGKEEYYTLDEEDVSLRSGGLTMRL